MTKEDLRLELLAGLITESEYREGCEKISLTESKSKKKSLKENIAYPDVIGGERTPKTDYEMAFEFYSKNVVNENDFPSEDLEMGDWDEMRDSVKNSPNFKNFFTSALDLAGELSDNGFDGGDIIKFLCDIIINNA
jgi:hypothetical protein